MGGGSYSSVTYSSHVADKAATGIPIFDHDHTVRTTGDWKVHELLDPKSVNKAGDHAGRNIRESLDSDEHPDSVAIAVIFDVTGSMGGIPRVLQTKLPALFGMLQRRGLIEHPQVLFGAIGDATCDRIPLQIGQFESDNRVDESLEKIVLEGGGGGQKTESYELAMYFVARHTHIDCFEKRGKRGYLFLMGDEMPYSRVDRRQVESLIGDTIEAGLTTEALMRELQEKWEVFYFQPADSPSYPDDNEVLGMWRKLLNQNAIRIDHSDAVCESIATAIAVCEGMDLEEASRDLVAVGASSGAAGAASSALAPLAASRGGAVAVAEGDLGDLSGPSSAVRL